MRKFKFIVLLFIMLILNNKIEYNVHAENTLDRTIGRLTIYVRYENDGIFEFQDGTKFTVYDEENNLVGTYETENGIAVIYLNNGYYKIYTEYKEGYLDLGLIDITIRNNDTYTYHLDYHKIDGFLIINKYYGYKNNYHDDYDSEFELYDSEGNYIKTYEGGNNRIYDTLEYGDYYVKQIKGKEGYKLIDRQDLYIRDPYMNVLNLYSEREKGSLTINKYYGYNDNYELEEDAKFEIYDINDNLVDTLKTVNGVAEVELSCGEYYVKQIKGKEGYEFINRMDFSITDNSNHEINLYSNQIMVDLTVNKYYETENGYELEDGAMFELYDTDDNLIQTFETKNGIYTTQIPYGYYYINQIKGARGYYFSYKTYMYVSNEEPIIQKLYSNKIRNNLYINKYYQEKDNYILEDGALFELYDINDNLITVLQIIKGKVAIELPFGDYYLIQIKGTKGTQILDKINFSIGDGKGTILNLYSDKVSDELTLNKHYQNENGYELEDGAKFELYDINDNLIDVLETVNGVVTIDLPYGDYYLIQIDGKYGYSFIDRIDFKVDDDSGDFELNLYDDRIYRKVTINKYYESNSGYNLEDGAMFELYDINDNLTDVLETVNGVVTIDLPYGDYYLIQIDGKYGYSFIDRIDFKVDDDSGDFELNLYDDRIYRKVTINKYYESNSGYNLEDGAMFELYDTNDNLMDILETVNGVVTIDLPYGDYYLIQIDGKYGYNFIDKLNFKVDDDSGDFELNLYDNKIYKTVTINKYYGNNDNYKLEDGAMFELYDTNDNLMDTLETINGVVTIDLPYGDYYLVQISGKYGYNYIEKINFKVDELSNSEINLYDNKIYKTVTINKYYGNNDNYKLEDGAKFELYDTNDNLINPLETVNGVVTIDLPYGDYYLEQIEGKEGYKFVDKINFSINEDNNAILDLYDDQEEIIVDVPDTLKNDKKSYKSIILITFGILLIIIDKIVKRKKLLN